MVPALRITDCWNYFLGGTDLTQRQKYIEHIPQVDQEKVLFWIDKLSKASIGELHEMGTYVVSAAWTIITNGIRTHFANKQWEVIYSKSTDPRDWDRLANDNPHLVRGRPLPFGLTEDSLKEMQTKVTVILTNLVKPVD
jgi:hypothetical protein